jgi:hypothetical protein
VGKYSPGGLGACGLCPPGLYGATLGLTNSSCSAPCPGGKYGNSSGLDTAECSGNCSAGRLGAVVSLLLRVLYVCVGCIHARQGITVPPGLQAPEPPRVSLEHTASLVLSCAATAVLGDLGRRLHLTRLYALATVLSGATAPRAPLCR